MDESSLSNLSYNDLRKKCKDLGLKASGKKVDLVKRILDVERSTSSSEDKKKKSKNRRRTRT